MQRSANNKLIIYLLLFLTIAGCTGDIIPLSSQESVSRSYATKTDMALSSLIPTIEPVITATNTLGITATVTQEQKSGSNLISRPLPDLLLSVNRASRAECFTQGSEEIWLASYPYSTPKLLLSNSAVDYRFPTWSPDGKRIAYVESRTEIIYQEDIGQRKMISGVDSVWVTHPDGLEKRQISIAVPSALFSHLIGTNVVCDVITEIASPLQWSPDGKYLVFLRAWIEANTRWNYSYYLTEISTGKSHALITQERKANILWNSQSDQILIQGDTELFNQIDVHSVDNLEIEQIKFVLPIEAKSNISYEFRLSESENILYSIFEFGDENDQTNTPERVAIWKYNLLTNQWNKITEIPIRTWYRTTIFNDQIISCDTQSKEIQLFEQANWNKVGVLKLPSSLYIQCVFQDFKELRDRTGSKWAIFEGSLDETQKGLWAVQLQPSKEAKLELIFDYSSITGKMDGISRFSFKP